MAETRFKHAPLREVRLGPADVVIERRGDGVLYARSPHALGPYPRALTERLVHWATVAPDRAMICERAADGGWRRVTYAQALAQARRIGAALVTRGLSCERPVAILSGNDIEHYLLTLACLHVGVPVAPVSPAYALVSRDFGKLKHILKLLTPGLVFAASGVEFAPALAAVMPADAELVVTRAPPPGRAAIAFADLASDDTGPADVAHKNVSGDTVAKFLFTSGSTGEPKGVINTQRMLTSNLAMIGASFPCLEDEPPVLVDWLPWNHTFGGNHNAGIALTFGGTLYIDAGKPAPGAIATTIANLREIAPTIYFNVPKGYEALLPYLRREPALRDRFFSRLQMNFFAGASLPQHVFDALDELAVASIGKRVLMMSGLGATETAPSAMFCTPETSYAGGVGLPVPGCELKLVPNGGKLEARFAGPNVTPGYWRDTALTQAAFDEEGFYRIGDALRFADINTPRAGFLFDGRVAEDFKLASGTWVSTGPLRASFIAAFAPYVRDIVIAGHDRDELTGIVLPDAEACRSFACVDALQAEFATRLAAFTRAASGSSTEIRRIVLLQEAPSIDAGEVTDKGSINQRAVLAHRPDLVEALYAATPDARIIAAAPAAALQGA